MNRREWFGTALLALLGRWLGRKPGIDHTLKWQRIPRPTVGDRYGAAGSWVTTTTHPNGTDWHYVRVQCAHDHSSPTVTYRGTARSTLVSDTVFEV